MKPINIFAASFILSFSATQSVQSASLAARISTAHENMGVLSKALKNNNHKRVFDAINGHYKVADETALKALVDIVNGGKSHIMCVKSHKIVADTNVKNVGKKADDVYKDAKGHPISKHIIESLHPKNDVGVDERVSSIYNVSTGVEDPADNAKTLSQKNVFVTWGRQALLAEKFDKTGDKFFCTMSFPAPAA